MATLQFFKDKTLMITGGTGSFGSTVLKHFLNSDLSEIRIFPAMRKNRMICVMNCKQSIQILQIR